MNITFNGSSITLKGNQLKIGDKMPDFTVCDNDLNVVKGNELSDVRIFLTVPSLDTGVCDMEVRNFNSKASELEGVSIYAVSLDLPFAQARWCGANGIKAVKTLSDYKDRNFGMATGTFIEELALLTRAVFIVNNANEIVYVEYVPEVTNHPDYNKAYSVLEELIK